MKQNKPKRSPFKKTELRASLEKASSQAALLKGKKTTEVINKAFHKAVRHKSRFFDIWLELMTLFHLLKSYFRRDYTGIGWPRVSIALAAVIYLLNPVDLVFDPIPIKGLVDDFFIMTYVIKELSTELAEFKKWLKEKSDHETKLAA